MKEREYLKALVHAVNSGLTAYIATHDSIFDGQATLKSLIKNIFGFGVPMEKLLAEAERLVPMWAAIHASAEELRTSLYPRLSDDEKRYFNLLSRYESALRNTVGILVDRQRLMAKGAIGGSNNPMTWQALQEIERAYERSIEEYEAIGQDLNDAHHIVFD